MPVVIACHCVWRHFYILNFIFCLFKGKQHTFKVEVLSTKQKHSLNYLHIYVLLICWSESFIN